MIRNWFLPHKYTHKKAHLISWEGLLVYVLLFMLLQVSFSIIGHLKPGILGISAAIDHKKIIELTNNERTKLGLGPLKENEALAKAALMKADNMFEENYWAHFAPSGYTPWDFILGAGYQFTFAGENLAKNFYTADDIVAAWMASPTHKENILNPRYQDIGIVVTEGLLNGQKTTLVVQMFGNTQALASIPTVSINGQKIAVEKKDYQQTPQLVASIKTTSPSTTSLLIDPNMILKNLGLFVIAFIVLLLMVDFMVLRKRGVFRISSHHLAHMVFLSAAAATILSNSGGSIL